MEPEVYRLENPHSEYEDCCLLCEDEAEFLDWHTPTPEQSAELGIAPDHLVMWEYGLCEKCCNCNPDHLAATLFSIGATLTYVKPEPHLFRCVSCGVEQETNGDAGKTWMADDENNLWCGECYNRKEQIK